jgi:hypothetical protein
MESSIATTVTAIAIARLFYTLTSLNRHSEAAPAS